MKLSNAGPIDAIQKLERWRTEKDHAHKREPREHRYSDSREITAPGVRQGGRAAAGQQGDQAQAAGARCSVRGARGRA